MAQVSIASREKKHLLARRRTQITVNRTTALTTVLAILLALAIIGTVLIIVFPNPGAPFTELYLLGPDGKASNYPMNLTVNQTANVTVGVVNHENANVAYKLTVTLSNKTINTTSFSLANNEKWEQSISFAPTQRGMGQKIEFDLFKGGDPSVYRSVYLFINVT